MAAKRSGPLGVLWRAIFALPFILVGLGTGATGIASGEPAMIVFGLVFAGAGALVLYSGIRDMRSRESRGMITPAAVTRAPLGPSAFGGYRANAGPRAPTALEVYGAQLPYLPVQKLAVRRGRTLPFALGRRDAYAGWALLGFSIFWSAIVVPFFLGAVLQRSPIALFLLLFLGVGLLVFISALKRLIALRKVVAVEVDAEPAFLGDAVTIGVAQRGPVKITRIVGAVVCTEHVTYRVGTKTRSEKAEVYRAEFLDEIGVAVPRGETWTRQLRVTLPHGPASFRAPNNEVSWSVEVKAEIDAWPDYEEMFSFRALPKVSG